jgi:F-type H+-transporting ATPase subunit b
VEHHETLLTNPRVWVAVAFFIFFGLLGKKLWTAMTAMLDKRTEAVRAELAEAMRLREEAEATLRDAEARRAQAAQEAEAMLASARSEAERIATEARAEMEAAAKRRERMALDRIAAAEQAATREVRDAAIEIATKAAQVVLEQAAPEQDPKLIDHAIGGLPKALRTA